MYLQLQGAGSGREAVKLMWVCLVQPMAFWRLHLCGAAKGRKLDQVTKAVFTAKYNWVCC
jgi:hypothetical protein